MALTEQIVTTGSWLEDGQIQVKRSTHVLDNGVRVAERLPHRHVLEPGQDVSTEDARVQRVCSALWTVEVVAEFNRKKAEAEAARIRS